MKTLLIASVTVLPLVLAGCEVGPKQSTQMGYRGTAVAQIVDPDSAPKLKPIPANAYDTPEDTGQRAKEAYQNVPVLGNISTERFNHLMANMNNWVVPAEGLPVSEQGCNYCHNPNNMASDEKYTKVVARKMIQMTQNINVNWSSHVQQTGVTCWTCHRGNAVPANKWAMADTREGKGLLQSKRGQNTPDASVGYASLPYDPYAPYLMDKGVNNIRVASASAYPSDNHVVSTKTAETTYGLMMHMSKGLGVNCTYCHNSASFRNWDMSSVQRVTAWYGLRMTAVANRDYVTPLTNVIPAVHSVTGANQYRKGPMGDPYKINCATCHNGQNKPMNGVSMRPIAPALWPASYGPRVLGEGFAPKADPNATAATCNIAFARALTGKTIEFQTASASIRPSSTALLDSLVQIAGRCSNFKMTVEGHTDAVGDAAVNLKLSEARAAAVDSYLTQKGVADEQLTARGFGAMRPLDTTGSAAGNQRNRRIEINVGTAGGQVAAVATRKGA